ncbi:MAG: c-type cytochrome [Proteobacteria bacterium]|nr:c-type cytochrome [Pseudomonadota bacterium]
MRRALLAAALGGVVATAHADGSAELRLRSLAATCAGCHGTDGRAAADATLPALAGMDAAVLAERMRAFKAGTRPGTVMPQIAKGYSDAQIAALAGYFAARPAARP